MGVPCVVKPAGHRVSPFYSNFRLSLYCRYSAFLQHGMCNGVITQNRSGSVIDRANALMDFVIEIVSDLERRMLLNEQCNALTFIPISGFQNLAFVLLCGGV